MCSSPVETETQCNLVPLALKHLSHQLPRLSPWKVCLSFSALKSAFWWKDYSLKTWFLKKWHAQAQLRGGWQRLGLVRLWGLHHPRPGGRQYLSSGLCSTSASARQWGKKACERGGRAKSTAWGVSLNTGRRSGLFQLVIQASLGHRRAGFCGPLVLVWQSSCCGWQSWPWGELIPEQNWNHTYFQTAVCF